jgi:hypothetical protein
MREIVANFGDTWEMRSDDIATVLVAFNKVTS